MALPQSFSSTIKYDLEDFKPHFIAKIQSDSRIKEHNKKLIFDNEIFFIKFRTLFSVTIKKNEITVSYEIDAVPLIKAITALLVFAALFSSFTTGTYFYFGAITSVFLYILGLLFVRSQFFGLFRAFMINPEESLSDEQISWIANPDKCSACGEELLKYQSKCHSCGLQSRPPIRFSPFSTTIPQIKMRYKYKE